MVIDKPSKRIIYHYTTFEGLEGILKTRSLWLSHNSSLNDYSEGKYWVGKLIRLAQKTNLGQKIYADLESVKEGLEVGIEDTGTCIVSFCLQGNLLSQWRAYANDGHGIALGIDIEKLKHVSKSNKYYLGSCVYTDQAQLQKFQRMSSIFNPSGAIQYDSTLVKMIVSSFFCKHEGFEAEEEYRIFTVPKINLDYRKISSRIIPYHKMSLGANYSWLKEIIVGPCLQKVAIKKTIEVLLKKNKVYSRSVKISCSDIPYRSLKYY